MPFWVFMAIFLVGVLAAALVLVPLRIVSRAAARRKAVRLFPEPSQEEERQNYVDLRLAEGGIGALPLLTRPYVAYVKRAEKRTR